MLRSSLAADFHGFHTIVHARSIYGVVTVYSIWRIVQAGCSGDGTLHAHWVVYTEPYNVETSNLIQKIAPVIDIGI